MALTKIQSTAFIGIDAVSVDVEVDVHKATEKTFLIIVGLPDTAVRESKDRVLTAIKNSGFKTDALHCTVNLAPGDLKKEGPLYDLPIALGLLRSSGILNTKIHEDYLCAGELSLSGEMRPIRGALSMALLARHLHKKGVVIPSCNAQEAAAVPDIQVIGINNLQQACRFFQNPETIAPTVYEGCPEEDSYPIDFSDIRGQGHVKRALEIAAAGAHNILLYGPPGSGKTLLAKAFSSILPPLSIEESLEVTRVHSIAGRVPEGRGLVKIRPFRSPHHTVSSVGLIGGGSFPKPGEISLAHLGVLFLDELPEFARSTLEVLRQPLENRQVTISRAQGSVTFPTSCICIAAMNPCPCGFLGHPQKPCRDTPLQIQKYRSKISGPLLDRIDLHVEVPFIPFQDLEQKGTTESSFEIQKRVTNARQTQGIRQKKANALLTSKEVATLCSITAEGSLIMGQAMGKLGLSARGYHRILKVARTIADLKQSPEISKEDLMEALSYRNLE